MTTIQQNRNPEQDKPEQDLIQTIEVLVVELELDRADVLIQAHEDGLVRDVDTYHDLVDVEKRGLIHWLRESAKDPNALERIRGAQLAGGKR